MNKIHLAACAAAFALSAAGAGAQVIRIDPATDRPKPDLSAKPRTGKASFYATFFGGRTMADGTPMRLDGDNAASRTLPLGTVARVTNLSTGLSAVVRIRDRGPYVQGRIVDLSPATAQQIGITPKMGLAMVEVTPIKVPLPNGGVRWGDLAEVARADDDGSTRGQ
ncbi:MAG TPA: septal ring lytic transglycosylase RlpA family protein [Burkholderiaceae bacterium]